eukprot:3578056-Rhodomonas_salina.3
MGQSVEERGQGRGSGREAAREGGRGLRFGPCTRPAHSPTRVQSAERRAESGPALPAAGSSSSATNNGCSTSSHVSR